MLEIKNQKANILPYVDVVCADHLLGELFDLMTEYLIEHKMRIQYDHSLRQGAHISGIVNWHHDKFSRYFNMHHHESLEKARTVEGEFSIDNIPHTWIVIGGNLIVDFGIKQFYQYLPPRLTKNNFNIFVSDNHLNDIYHLYQY